MFAYTVAVAKKTNAKPPVVRGAVDISTYEAFDAEWRSIGLAAPARRALVDANLFKVSDLDSFFIIILINLK